MSRHWEATCTGCGTSAQWSGNWNDMGQCYNTACLVGEWQIKQQAASHG
jgi:hypothetical protein